PLLTDSTGRAVQLLNPTGLVLGVEPGVTWREETVVLGVGDRLLLYTDGVTEAQDALGAFFETAQLLATLASAPVMMWKPPSRGCGGLCWHSPARCRNSTTSRSWRCSRALIEALR